MKTVRRVIIQSGILILCFLIAEISLLSFNGYEKRIFSADSIHIDSKNAQNGGMDDKGAFLVNNFEDVNLYLNINERTETVEFVYSSPKVLDGDICVQDEASKYYWKYGKLFYLTLVKTYLV